MAKIVSDEEVNEIFLLKKCKPLESYRNPGVTRDHIINSLKERLLYVQTNNRIKRS